MQPYGTDRLVSVGERFQLAYDHAENADGGSVAVKLMRAQRKLRIDAVEYVNPTGLAADVANFAVLSLKNGATVVADWSTETGEEGTIAADTFVDFTLSATDTELIFDAGDELSFVVAESGTTTVPAGRVIVHGRYVP